MLPLWLGAFLIGIWLALHLALRRRGATSVVAHRGAAAVAPENTLAAVDIGMKSGAEFIEIDVRRCKDGELVVIHDATVGRTTNGTGAVDDLSLREIKALDAGSWFSKEFRGERVPTLSEVLGRLASWPGVLALEVKSPGRYPGIAQELAGAIDRFAPEQVSILSFDHNWLALFHELIPHIPVTELSILPSFFSSSQRTARIGVNWLAPLLDPTLITRCHRRGQQIWVWTIDQPWQQRLLRWLGVDGITVNNPAQAVSLL